MQWVLLLARHDRHGSEVMSSGELDLARCAAIPQSTKISGLDFSLEILPLAEDGASFAIHMEWREDRAPALDAPRPPRDVRHVQIPLDMVPVLSQDPEKARSKVLSVLIRTSLKRTTALNDHFRQSKDGLQLFALFPSTDDLNLATLSIFRRASLAEGWQMDATVELDTHGHDRILGTVGDWLILADEHKGSVQIWCMRSPLVATPRTFPLLNPDEIPRTTRDGAAQPEEKKPEKTKPAGTSFHILAGRVIFTTDWGVVRGIIELNTDEEPYLVDVPRLIRLCLRKRDSTDPDLTLPKSNSNDNASFNEGGRERIESINIDAGSDDADGESQRSSSIAPVLLCFGEPSPPLEERTIHLSFNDTERPVMCGEAHSRKPLLLYIRSTEEVQEEGSDYDDEEPFYTMMWQHHAVLLQPQSRNVTVVLCNRGYETEEYEDPGLLFRYAAHGQSIVDYHEYPESRWEDDPAARMLTDFFLGTLGPLIARRLRSCSDVSPMTPHPRCCSPLSSRGAFSKLKSTMRRRTLPRKAGPSSTKRFDAV